MTSNAILAKRIAELERMLSNANIVSNQLLEENKNLLLELSAQKDLLDSSMLSEATAKQYAEEIDKQNKELAAQVEAFKKIREDWRGLAINDAKTLIAFIEATDKTPQQHLRELRAEAGRAGYFVGYTVGYCDRIDGILAPITKSNQYAEQIRRGEVE